MTLEETKLAKTIEQLELMNDALRLLRTDVLPRNPHLFALLAEGPLTEIDRLRSQIARQAQALVPAAQDNH